MYICRISPLLNTHCLMFIQYTNNSYYRKLVKKKNQSILRNTFWEYYTIVHEVLETLKPPPESVTVSLYVFGR